MSVCDWAEANWRLPFAELTRSAEPIEALTPDGRVAEYDAADWAGRSIIVGVSGFESLLRHVRSRS